MLSFPILVKLFVFDSNEDKWVPIEIGKLTVTKKTVAKLTEPDRKVQKTIKFNKEAVVDLIIKEKNGDDVFFSTRLKNPEKVMNLDSTLISMVIKGKDLDTLQRYLSNHPSKSLSISNILETSQEPEIAISFLDESTRNSFTDYIAQALTTDSESFVKKLEKVSDALCLSKIYRMPKENDKYLLAILFGSFAGICPSTVWELKRLPETRSFPRKEKLKFSVDFDEKLFSSGLLKIRLPTVSEFLSNIDNPILIMEFYSASLGLDIRSYFLVYVKQQPWYSFANDVYEKLLALKLIFSALRRVGTRPGFERCGVKVVLNEEVKTINKRLLVALESNNCKQLRMFRKFGDKAVEERDFLGFSSYLKLLEDSLYISVGTLDKAERKRFVGVLNMKEDFVRINVILTSFAENCKLLSKMDKESGPRSTTGRGSASGRGSFKELVGKNILLQKDYSRSESLLSLENVKKRKQGSFIVNRLISSNKSSNSSETYDREDLKDASGDLHEAKGTKEGLKVFLPGLFDFMEVLLKVFSTDAITSLLQAVPGKKEGRFLVGDKIFHSKTFGSSESDKRNVMVNSLNEDHSDPNFQSCPECKDAGEGSNSNDFVSLENFSDLGSDFFSSLTKILFSVDPLYLNNELEEFHFVNYIELSMRLQNSNYPTSYNKIFSESDRLSIKVSAFKRVFFSVYFNICYGTLGEGVFYKNNKTCVLRLRTRLELFQGLINIHPGKFYMNFRRASLSEASYTNCIRVRDMLLKFLADLKALTETLTVSNEGIEVSSDHSEVEPESYNHILVINKYLILMDEIFTNIKTHKKLSNGEKVNYYKCLKEEFLEKPSYIESSLRNSIHINFYNSLLNKNI